MESYVYYLTLYVFVLIIRFFKLKRQFSNNFSAKWYETFHGSLEIVYTASGFVIALLLNVNKSWIPAVIAIYLLVVVFSAFLEMSNEGEFKPIPKTFLHVLIISIMMVSTVVSYTYIIPKADINGNVDPNKLQPIQKSYTIIVPYFDNSIANHIGYNKMIGKTFYYECNMNAFNTDSLVINTLASIYHDTLIKPIIHTKYIDLNDIQILTEKIKVVETRNLEKIYLR